jgi:hypothetical protein
MFLKAWMTRLWTKFPGGPDWVYERKSALAYLDRWQETVIAENDWTPIIVILTMANGPAGGVGKQLANDLLYELAIHPDMPSIELCSSPELYGALRSHLPTFMDTWVSPEFLKRCAGQPNSLNPFLFHVNSDRNFISSFVKVYRKREARVPETLYNLYQSRGLFDPDHIIGSYSPFILTSIFDMLLRHSVHEGMDSGVDTEVGRGPSQPWPRSQPISYHYCQGSISLENHRQGDH